jgi:hypothetical protein
VAAPQALHDRMLKILDNKDKIPYTKKIGEQLYNLWRVRADFVWPRLAM